MLSKPPAAEAGEKPAKMISDIRRLESASDLNQCVEIQVRVWGLAEAETVSARTLATCIKHKALLLGSFQNNLLAGFCFSIPACWSGAPSHHSHMLAVLPEFRDQGIGFDLKQAQFNSLRQDFKWITWTFDPLESRNANLNLKLGVSIDTYVRNLYGGGENCSLHKGIGTDRFIAEWSTAGTGQINMKTPLPSEIPKNIVIETEWDENGFFKPVNNIYDRREAQLFLEIPEDIQKIKNYSLQTAREWRTSTRKTLEHYFSRKYAIRRFHSFMNPETNTRRSFYNLVR